MTQMNNEFINELNNLKNINQGISDCLNTQTQLLQELMVEFKGSSSNQTATSAQLETITQLLDRIDDLKTKKVEKPVRPRPPTLKTKTLRQAKVLEYLIKTDLPSIKKTADKSQTYRPPTRRSSRIRRTPDRMGGILTGYSLEKHFSPKNSQVLTRPTLRRCSAITSPSTHLLDEREPFAPRSSFNSSPKSQSVNSSPKSQSVNSSPKRRSSTRSRKPPTRMDGILTGASLEKVYSPSSPSTEVESPKRRSTEVESPKRRSTEVESPKRRSTRSRKPPTRMDGILTGASLEKVYSPSSSSTEVESPKRRSTEVESPKRRSTEVESPKRRSTRTRKPPTRMEGILTGDSLNQEFTEELGIEFFKKQVEDNIQSVKPVWFLDKFQKNGKTRSCWRTARLYSPNEDGVWVCYYGWSYKWDQFIRWDSKDLLTRVCYPLVGVLDLTQICNTQAPSLPVSGYISETELKSIKSEEDMEKLRDSIRDFSRKSSGVAMDYQDNQLTPEQIRKGLTYIQENLN